MALIRWRDCRVSDAVSVGMNLSFDAIWERGVEFPSFKVDSNSAVEFLRAVLDSPAGTRINNSFRLREAVAVQTGQLFLIAKDARAKHVFAPHTGFQAVYALLASILYFKQRVPAPSTYALKHLANALTRKGGGKMFVDKRGSGLLEAFRVSINQRRYDTKLSCRRLQWLSSSCCCDGTPYLS
eukprot:4733081-Pleurochrysis_carterae.AAC.1